jgi:hypothetical protein
MLACQDFLQVPREGVPSTLQMMGNPALQVRRFRNRSRRAFCTYRRVCFVANHRILHALVFAEEKILCNLFGGKVNEARKNVYYIVHIIAASMVQTTYK